MTPDIAKARIKIEKIVAKALDDGCDRESLFQSLAELANDWSDELEKIDDAKGIREMEDEPDDEGPFKSPLPPSIEGEFWKGWEPD